MSVCYALLARLLVLVTGGSQIDIWVLLCLCRLIDGLLIQEMSILMKGNNLFLRLDFLSEGIRLEECMNIGMCSVTCPKDLDPRFALQDLLKMVKERKIEKEYTCDLL
jgi:hypothetical protein